MLTHFHIARQLVNRMPRLNALVLSPLKEPFLSPVACVSRGPLSEKGEAPGGADSLTRGHLLGDNLMDVVDSAFSIHNL